MLLRDQALAVLFIRAPRRDGDLLLRTGRHQIEVDARTTSVGIAPQERERDHRPGARESLEQLILAALAPRWTLALAGRPSGHAKGGPERASRTIATLGDQIGRTEARRGGIPVREGAHGDLALE
jgi:hypothetical protein